MKKGEKQNLPYAVIMGLTASGLSLARSLGRRGINVIGLSTTNQAIGASSKYLKFIKSPNVDEEPEMLGFLLDLSGTIDNKPVLMPTGDQNLMFMSKYRNELKNNFHFIISDHELLLDITSKRKMIEYAKTKGFPLPYSIIPEKIGDIEEIQLDYPCMVKPEFTHLWLSEKAKKTKLYSQKAISVNNHSEMISLYQEIEKLDKRIIIQQLVAGPDKNHYDYNAFVDKNGKIRSEFVSQKIRLTPPYFGMGSHVKSIHSDEIIELSRSIISKIDFCGPINIDFKQDINDKKFYMFEINPRFSHWTTLDVFCGIDLPYYYYADCIGKEFEVPKSYPAGRRGMNLAADVDSMMTYVKDGSWTWLKWPEFLLHPIAGDIWAWDDPSPGINQIKNYLKRIKKKIFGK